MIRFLTFLLICCLIAALCSCSKSFANEQQRMYRVSEWYELNWKPRSTSKQEVSYNIELLKYRDTTVFPITCPLSGIEIRYYKIQ